MKMLVYRMFDGIPVIAKKREDKANLSTVEAYPVNDAEFDEIKEELADLDDRDFVLTGFLVKYQGKFPISKNKLINREKSGRYKLHIYDVIYAGEKIANTGWRKRHKVLNNMDWTGKVKFESPTVVDNVESLNKTVKMFDIIQGTTGIMIRHFDEPVESKKYVHKFGDDDD